MKKILWFRRDLRVDDNKLLSLEGEVFPIFIFDTNILSKLDKDDKRVSLIFDFVMQLKTNLKTIGLDLKIFYGDPIEVFNSLNLSEFDEVVASGDYDSYAKERDLKISHLIHFRYINDIYLFKPKEVLKDDGTPYLVFTPFYKKARVVLESKNIDSIHKVKQILYKANYESKISLESMGFVKQEVFLNSSIEKKIDYLKENLKNYQEKRDYLDSNVTSDLSIELRFGLIGIRRLIRELKGLEGSESFIRQLIFRDYYAYLLFHFPYIETKNYKYSFNGIQDKEKLNSFINAQTGFPLIDAGVQELLKTGKMHNRVRMVVASFFTKDLLLPWQWGESFFAKHLLDYDVASNVLSWQWSAGTGVDPQPYFRIFNPYLQSKKFDKETRYIKKHLPQLDSIDSKNLHNEIYLLDNTIYEYPRPIVNHKIVAKIAIEKFKNGM